VLADNRRALAAWSQPFSTYQDHGIPCTRCGVGRLLCHATNMRSLTRLDLRTSHRSQSVYCGNALQDRINFALKHTLTRVRPGNTSLRHAQPAILPPNGHKNAVLTLDGPDWLRDTVQLCRVAATPVSVRPCSSDLSSYSCAFRSNTGRPRATRCSSAFHILSHDRWSPLAVVLAARFANSRNRVAGNLRPVGPFGAQLVTPLASRFVAGLGHSLSSLAEGYE